MRMSTNVFLSLWQSGVPGSHRVEGPLALSSAIKRVAEYLMETPMRGSKFEFRISTKRENIEYAGPNANHQLAGESLMDELEGLFNAEAPEHD